MMKKAILKVANKIAYKFLPPAAYIRVAAALIPVFDSGRRNSKSTFSVDGDLFVAHLKRGDFFFNSQFKVGRFLYPGVRFGDMILQKYSDERVFVSDNDTVIDVGANIGEFSIAASRIAARVIAIEPDESAFRCLSLNSDKEGEIICMNIAAAETDGVVDFYLSPGTSDSSLLKPSSRVTSVTKVPGLTLKTIMRKNNLRTIEFLKLEAEGYEPEILRGAGDALRAVKKVAIDTSPERYGETTSQACVDILESQNFSVWNSGWIVFGVNNCVAQL